MLLEDYSQLPVMVNDRDVKGVISWRSIGAASVLGEEGAEVRHYMEQHREVHLDAPFLDTIKDIWNFGYVLVSWSETPTVPSAG